MLICTECGELIEDNDNLSTITEPHGEVCEVCPRCNSIDIVEARICDSCGEYFASEYLDDGWCDKCKRMLIKDMALHIDSFFDGKNYPSNIREVMNDLYDGKEIC